ncbi:MAG: hypothetical protein IJM62_04925, partial [Lachnospiraceae bacterium]|nr:hypothetical protein [Lachnospiraceae bacterium]
MKGFLKKLASVLISAAVILQIAANSPLEYAYADDEFYGDNPLSYSAETFHRDRNNYEEVMLYPGETVIFDADTHEISGQQYMGFSYIGPLPLDLNML